MINYPLKFEPILKSKIWGGDRLIKKFNKISNRTDVGESWEISDVPGDISVVSNGHLKGATLKSLMEKYKGHLLGDQVFKEFGLNFPLLIKFIDAKEALSIQLHPDDILAKERHHSFGKTEMWYIMDSEEDGNLVVGFKKDSNKEEYLAHLKNGNLLDLLNIDRVKEGDVYFIPTGRVHAIGAGVVLAEIQQTSDITYRIYDWDRTDSEGKSRELHTELALDAIDFKTEEDYSINYTKTLNNGLNLVDCQYFTTNFITLNNSLTVNHNDKDSFVIYICVKGALTVLYDENKTESLVAGQTLMLPATLKSVKFDTNLETEILEVYIKQ